MPEATVPEVQAWLAGRVPDGWFSGPPEVSMDGDEMLVVGNLPDVEVAKGSKADAKTAARSARVDRFREETREQRMRIAQEAEHLFRRKVSWGAACGGERKLFTTMSTPVMTRLRIAERHVLDTLVESGVARSRSDALAWCVRLVGQNQESWIKDLRDALVKVGEVRQEGPKVQ
jgi:hypothetical protein